ncbi:MAG TPA: type VI secretion system accessory protein TagJ, partial [Tepidisphaeraceae bacterium]
QVRQQPAESKHRVFLFQLLSVMGQWDRALTQLNVAAELDPSCAILAQMYAPALQCEALRAEVFAGRRTPLVFGEPEPWIGEMIQANQLSATAQHAAAQALRAQALEAAPATPGMIDGQPFEWLADADSRLGPMLEVILNGQYYWTPFNRIRAINTEVPADLRDLVWLPAQFQWTNGGEAFALIPARYPGSEASNDDAIRLGRKTEWVAHEQDVEFGLGQRLLATDASDCPLLATRAITLGDAAAAAPAAGVTYREAAHA